MPMPTEDRVSTLLAAPIARRGYDLESVRVAAAGARTTVRVMVDGDDGVDLDAIAELSTELSQILDDAGEFGATPYTLEVTTPGIDRPLTLERHWRRARARLARLSLTDGRTLSGRIGEVAGANGDLAVAIVVPGKGGPSVEQVRLADIDQAVVQVEFSRADPRELALAGGVPDGRPVSGAEPAGDIADDTDDMAEETGQ